MKKTAYAFVLLLSVILASFFISRFASSNPWAPDFSWQVIWDPERAELERMQVEKWALNAPLHLQLAKYVFNHLAWDLGNSIVWVMPFDQLLTSRIPYTLFLLVGSTFLALVVSVALGTRMAQRKNSLSNRGAALASSLLVELPVFWIGLLILWALSSASGWLLSIGGYALYALLPIAAIVPFLLGVWLPTTRSAMTEALSEDSVAAAGAEKLDENKSIPRRAFRNASLPVLRHAALSLGFAVSAVLMTEAVFGFAGLGHWVWVAIQYREYSVLMVVLYLVAFCVILANLMVDFLSTVMRSRT